MAHAKITIKSNPPSTEPPMMRYRLVFLRRLEGGGVRSHDPMEPPTQPQASVDMSAKECNCPLPCIAQQVPGALVTGGQVWRVVCPNGVQFAECTQLRCRPMARLPVK